MIRLNRMFRVFNFIIINLAAYFESYSYTSYIYS